MVKNWFTLIIGLQYLGAGTLEVVNGRPVLAVMFYAYAVAGIALAFV